MLVRAILVLALVAHITYALPSGFQVDKIMDVTEAMALPSLPDGRLLVAKRHGQILIIDPLSTQRPIPSQTYMTISQLNAQGERGLMSMTLDPNFESNGYFYVYYCAFTFHNRGFVIARFQHQENAGGLTSRGDFGSEFILWKDPDGIVGPYHYGGQLNFGPDGNLYVGQGDKYSQQSSSQNKHTAAGCIIRVTPTGQMPADNWGAQVGGHAGCWAYGLRNPYRTFWDIPSGNYFIAEVGGNKQAIATEDIHLGAPGINYGWPMCEGDCNNPDYPTCDCNLHDSAWYWYDHSGSNNPTGSNAALTGGVVYRGTMFPQEYYGKYFFGDYSRKFIKYIDFQGQTLKQVKTFESDPRIVGNVIHFEEAADGALLYSTLDSVYRISYFSATENHPPQISHVDASTTTGSPPLFVQFTAQTFDEDGDFLDHTWFFGDGSNSKGKNTQHTYTQAGTYVASMEVSDGKLTRVSDTIEISVGNKPSATIQFPPNNYEFVAGETITFQGEAIDGNGQLLGGSQLKWTVKLRHDDHTHPVLNNVFGTQGNLKIENNGHSFSDGISFVIDLEVTDLIGLQDFKTVEIYPKLVDLSFTTEPNGIPYKIDGLPTSGSVELSTLVGFDHYVDVPEETCIGDTQYSFSSWSSGKPREHKVTVPNKNTMFIAFYKIDGPCGGATVAPPTTEAPPPVAPTDLPTGGQGLVMHLVGDDLSSEGSAKAWNDKTNYNNDLVAIEGKPNVKQAKSMNNHYAVQFDGISDILGAESYKGLPMGDSPRTVVMVVKYLSAGWGGFSWGKTGCLQMFGPGVTASKGNLFVDTYCTGDTVQTGEPGKDAGWLIQTVTVDAGGVMKHYKDAELLETQTFKLNTAAGTIRLGAEHNDVTKTAMSVAEIIVYNYALDTDSRLDLYQYLNAKYFGSGVPSPSPPSPSPPGPSPPSPSPQVPTTTLPTGDSDLPKSSGLVMHLSGESVSTKSSLVTSWEDMSSSGNSLTPVSGQPVAANDADLNGHVKVVFDGKLDGLGRENFDGLPLNSDDRTAVMVVKYNGAGWGGFTWGQTGCFKLFGMGVTSSIGNLYVETFCSSNVEETGVKGSASGWVVQTVVLSNGKMQHFKNKELLETQQYSFATEDGKIRLGTEHNDNAKVNMEVAEIVVYDHALSAAEREQLVNFLTSKYFGDSMPTTTTSTTTTPTPSPPTGPSDLPYSNTLVMHLHSGAVSTSGASVSLWPDQTGQGHDLEPISGNAALVSNAVNGHPAVEFDGQDDVLGAATTGSLPIGTSDRTVMMVVKYESDGWGGFTYGDVGCLEVFGVGVTETNGNLFVESFCTSDTVQSGVSALGSGWMVHSVVLESGFVKHFQNEGMIESPKALEFNTKTGYIRLGSEHNNYSKIKMSVAEIIVFNSALPNAILASNVNYLKLKYGI